MAANRLEGILKRTPGAVRVQFGALETWGLPDRTTDPQQMGAHLPIAGVSYSVTIASGCLPGVKKRSAVTVAGKAHLVRDPPELIDDGALTKLWLEDA